MAEIRIGTASWTDPGFVEDWYPQHLPASQRLRWYAEHFNLVEINATFYALPVARTVERWCLDTPADFIFDVKLPKILSRHAMQPRFFPPDLRSRLPVSGGKVDLNPDTEKLVVERLLRELEPLLKAKKLGAFLLQLSPSFRPRTNKLTELDSLRELLAPYQLAVELRNRDWCLGQATGQPANRAFPERERGSAMALTGSTGAVPHARKSSQPVAISSLNRPEGRAPASPLDATIDYFKSRQMTLVLVDAPESEHFTVMPGFDCTTNPRLGYFRAHGRNAEGYIKGRTVAERFDYDYSPQEIAELAERLRKVSQEVDRLHVIANNNRSNYAPKLAAALRQALGQKRELQKKLEYIKKPKQGELI